jgi:hypothetical protein
MSPKKKMNKQPSALPAAAEPAISERPDPVFLARQTKWAFPTQARCPRCNGLQTRATSTQGPIQYRQCMAAICLYRFSIKGWKV